MKDCSTCGNEITDVTSKCPFCESQQTAGAPGKRARRTRVISFSVKKNMPTADEAVDLMESKLKTARQDGIRIIRLIHGYGASGKGGIIKESIIRRLPALKRDKIITDFVRGEDYIESDTGRRLRENYPELKDELRTDRNNPGITFIVV